MQFVVEYISPTARNNDTGVVRPSLNVVEADNLEMLTKKIEGVLKSGDADSAIIYAPRCSLQAERRVSIQEIGANVGGIPKAAGSTILGNNDNA
jgi:hypothetical protein